MKYIVYERDVCLIEEVKGKYIKGVDYYILRPLNDKTLKISVPVNSKLLRNLISLEDANKLINKMKSIEVIEDNKQIENEYKRLLDTGDLSDLVKIIKTTYLRNKERIINKKKISEKDDNYFNKAEDYLYTELGIVFNMSKENIKEYIIEKLK